MTSGPHGYVFLKHAFGEREAEGVLRAAKKYIIPKPGAVEMVHGRITRDIVGPRTHVMHAQKPELYAASMHAFLNPEGAKRMFRATPRAGFIAVQGPAAKQFGAIEKALYPAQEVLAPSLSGTSKKMLEAIEKGHELAEVVATPSKGMRQLGHFSPDVLLKEHNMVTTLPAEHSGVRAVMQKVRGAPGAEAEILRRYGVEYGSGERLSRHARRRITELMRKQGADVHGLDLSKDDNSKKSRKGMIPRNVETFLKDKKLAAFAEEMHKLSADDYAEEVNTEEAIKKLQKPKPWKNIAQTALLAGAAAPVIEGAGRFTKGFVDTPGGVGARFRGGLGHAAAGDLAAKGIRGMTHGDIVSRGLTAGLGGGVLSAAKEGLELHHARETLRRRLAMMDDPKVAAIGGISLPTVPNGPAAPTTKTYSSSNKAQRVGATPIAANSGVVRSQSGEAMNPRAPLSAAMKPKV